MICIRLPSKLVANDYLTESLLIKQLLLFDNSQTNDIKMFKYKRIFSFYLTNSPLFLFLISLQVCSLIIVYAFYLGNPLLRFTINLSGKVASIESITEFFQFQFIEFFFILNISHFYYPFNVFKCQVEQKEFLNICNFKCTFL